MELTTEKIIEELVAIGFARVTDILELRDGQTQLKPDAQGAAIANLETTPKGVKVKFYDKLKALELLGKHLGMFAGTGTDPEQSNLLDAILSAVNQKQP